MFGLDIAFDSPGYLLLLLLIPVLWVWSFNSLSGLGSVRRLLALLLRSLVLAGLIFALANLQLLKRNDRLTVIYLLDQSASIPVKQAEAMAEYVVKDVKRHRRESSEDQASVITFGRGANIEVPPLDDQLPIFRQLESVGTLERDATNLEGAMKLAQALFPENSAHRLVIVSDGNENLGNAEALAQQMIEDGVGIDVVPVWLSRERDVAVERVTLPTDIRIGQPFQATVVLNNSTPASVEGDQQVSGLLRVTRTRAGQTTTLSESAMTLKPGKTVLRFTDDIDQPDFYEYGATFVATNAAEDLVDQNNRATSFTQVRGKGNVLIVEDWENRDAGGQGELHYLAERLRAMELSVTEQFTDELFTNLAQLQSYDVIILGNVPRSSGDTAENMRNFSDAQVEALVRNTQQMGCGIIMLGGPNSFGAGGWANTKLEEAMPVDFQIKNAKVQAVGALAMVMHASEIAEGNYWQKRVGRTALEALGPQDYCAVVEWNSRSGKEGWLWGGRKGFLPVGSNKRMMMARMDRMVPGDMPAFEPSLQMALAAFKGLPQAAIKHMIIISDGDPTPPRGSVLRAMKATGIKVTTVAVGAHGSVGSRELEKISKVTGGKYYKVKSAKALPRIYQREARRVARPLIVERQLQPAITLPHEILLGIDSVPPIRGFVMTTLKENPLVEVSMMSPYPEDRRNATVLASWNYGLGRTAVFTSDAGYRWATDWTGWEQYDKFFGQLVRWAMRPTDTNSNYTVVTQNVDGKVKVIVDAIDKNDEFLNFQNVMGSVVGPDMGALDLRLKQTAPGRYVGEFEGSGSGTYFVTVSGGDGEPPVRAGVNVPYSSEYRDRQTNRQLLTSLASLTPKGGEAGQMMEGELAAGGLEELLSFDTFRRSLATAVSSTYIWPLLLVISSCLFFTDVFVRRVAVTFDWLPPLIEKIRTKLFGATDNGEDNSAMDRLKSRKAQISEDIDQRRAATRFEPDPEEPVDTSILDDPATSAPLKDIKRPSQESQLAPGEKEEDTFTSRLLKAKKDAIKDRDKKE